MKILILIIVIIDLSINLIALADEKITESYIEKLLEGKDSNENLSGNERLLKKDIPLLSFLIHFSPESLEIKEEAYNRLGLIAKIMNDKPLLNSKFSIVCCSGIESENHNDISHKLSENIKNFMRQQLSGDQERVIIRTADEHPSILPMRIETGTGTGRVEVFRLE